MHDKPRYIVEESLPDESYLVRFRSNDLAETFTALQETQSVNRLELWATGANDPTDGPLAIRNALGNVFLHPTLAMLWRMAEKSEARHAD